MLSLKNQLTMPRNKKKSQQIPELINQVSHREATGSQTAEKSEFWGLGRASKGRSHAAGNWHKPSFSSPKDQQLNETQSKWSQIKTASCPVGRSVEMGEFGMGWSQFAFT
jgi:hypothetical protein